MKQQKTGLYILITYCAMQVSGAIFAPLLFKLFTSMEFKNPALISVWVVGIPWNGDCYTYYPPFGTKRYWFLNPFKRDTVYTSENSRMGNNWFLLSICRARNSCKY